MLNWLSKSKKEAGWLAISLAPERVQYVHGQFAPGGKSVVPRLGASGGGAARTVNPEKFLRDLHAERYQCSTLLRPAEYQMLLVEAPNVPAAELKSAIRWRVKDLVDYPIDDAAIDVLDIPPEQGSAVQRGHSMYAVAARNSVIESHIRAFEEAKVPLSVIDIPEMAQRNIAALHEVEGRGLALLHIDRDIGLLTINFGGELYLARRMDIGFEALRAANGEAREALFNRIVVELQRTFDHFERQFRFIAVSGLLVGPQPEDIGLVGHLAANLSMDVKPVDLAGKIAFGRAGAPDAATQWSLFHLLGASLRHETRAL